MTNDDVQLIQRILAGDEPAFTELVKKYQKPVHTLAWRKIGDFHIAEEITQDTFLKVHQRLHTLKNPKQFAGWLYVITSNLCATWLRKKRIQTQPLEDEGTETTMIQRDAYSEYVVQEQAKVATEAQREVVKKLLAKLKESERTVIMLHYFAEMTCEEIGKFLGVSVGTIKSRLHRARQRLQTEETMIREALDHFQISPHLTDSIMREVARLKPAAPTGSKPLMPWAITASSVALILLMLGIGSQYLSRFQQPYSLKAETETTVDIIDAPIVLNLDVKPDVRNRLGNANAPGKTVLLAATQAEGEDFSVPKAIIQARNRRQQQQWIPSESTRGTHVESLLATSKGEIYTVADGHVYKLQNSETKWKHLSDISALIDDRLVDFPMAEWDDTLYILPSNKLLASEDGGKTWDTVHTFPEKCTSPYELVLTEQAFYLTFWEGTFRSEDKGETWDELSQELYAFVEIQNTVIASTGTELYRWNSDSWQRLEFPAPRMSLTATNDYLYAVGYIGQAWEPVAASEGRQQTWWIFRSTDLGNSWTDITPTNAWPTKGWQSRISLVAAGDTLIVMERGIVRSTDGGDTWMPPQLSGNVPMRGVLGMTAVALNEHVFYVNSLHGLHRSTDKGKSWNVVNVTPNKYGGGIDNLIVSNGGDNGQNRLPTIYGSNGHILKTTDNGTSWKTVHPEILMTSTDNEKPLSITQIVKSDGNIYVNGKGYDAGSSKSRLYRVSTDSNTLVTIPGMPIFDSSRLFHLIDQGLSISSDKSFAQNFQAFVEQLQESSHGATQFFKQLALMEPRKADTFRREGLGGALAVSDDTFFVEHNFKLLRWKKGDTEWYDTGVEKTTEFAWHIVQKELKLAASGNTVYAGKRDGHLVASFDKGNSWLDLTSALPFPVKTFKDIVFGGTTGYVATDAGVTASDNGKSWHPVTDAAGTNLIMKHLTVDGTTLYGITEKVGGIYRLENGTWQQVVSAIPYNVISLAVGGDTLYIGTENDGMLHYTLEK